MHALRGSHERHQFLTAVEVRLSETEASTDMNSAEAILKQLDTVLRDEGQKLFSRDAPTETDPDKVERLRLLALRRSLRERMHSCDPAELEECKQRLRHITKTCTRARKQ
eukprot:3560206-Pyramimonas_sp.AAC.1